MTQTSRTPGIDPAHDYLRYDEQPLDAIFNPQSVALIGATEKAGSVGRTILWNLISSPFGGTVFPINPKRPNVLGIKAYPNIREVPDPIDLAVIVTPAPTVPDIIGECVEAGVRGAIVISAGFKETGSEGVALETQIMAQARNKMRIVGPNCLGVMNCLTGMNATFANAIARPGKVGFISQSGALCTAVLDWSFKQNVGFTAFVSIGSMLDVGWGDLIHYLGDDPRTESIVIYMETIGDARGFLSAAREIALTKPIIVIKPGRTEGAAKAAASHTGSLTGSDEVLESAFRRSGVLRVNSISDLFYMSEVLSKQPRPTGGRLTIVTNAGGPGVLATDALLMGGGELTELSQATYEELNKILPPAWSHNNPVDVLGDASPERYAQTLEIAARDANSDGLLVILTPQAMTDATRTAEALTPFAHSTGKPVLASWMGGANVEKGEQLLNQGNIPTFQYPDTATRMFNYMWRYSYNLRGLYETPVLRSDAETGGQNRTRAAQLVDAVRASGRTIMTETESKQLLALYDIPIVPTEIAASEADAIAWADKFGYPVVLKIYSETITHKTDVGGVRLNLQNADDVGYAYRAIERAVRERVGAEHFQGVTVQPMIKLEGAYELIIGSSVDPQFGPVLLFGTGGQLVEVFKDRSLALPPLNTTLARRMMEQTRISRALKGVRGRQAVDMAALEQILVNFSQLIVEQPWIKELDINPLLAMEPKDDGRPSLIALDARVVVYGAETAARDLPRLAVRPYPSQYAAWWTLKNGQKAIIRPIRPEDEPMLVKFHQTLSDRSVNMRYLSPMLLGERVAHERLARLCFIDYDREMALVARGEDPDSGERAIFGVARLQRVFGSDAGVFNLLINDRYQGQGLGTELMRRLIAVGRAEGLGRIQAEFAPNNYLMRSISQKLGFTLTETPGAAMVRAELTL
ncbi:MAG: bifunctional acetate--CoA ligase family protein/GNAT family N-acetyltransferase [Anaerolineae bacterium]